MHIILHKRCSHYTQNMHIILHILCLLYAYNMRDSDFVLNQRLKNGLMFRLRWRRLFYKYSCCDTPSIDWSDFVWCAQPFPCQSFIVCFMANHVENTAALTCIWCIRLARTVNANKHSARFTGGRPQSTYSIPLPPFKVQERFTAPLHHSLGDIQRNGYRKCMKWLVWIQAEIQKGMHESRFVSIVTNPRKIDNKLQTRWKTDIPWSDIKPHRFVLLVLLVRATKVRHKGVHGAQRATMLTNTIGNNMSTHQPQKYIDCISIAFSHLSLI